MLAEEYVREKLREIDREASRSPNVAVDGVSFASPAARSLGRLLCRVGERLQWVGRHRECDAQAGRPREQSLRLRRTG
jgi:hypothetical protein